MPAYFTAAPASNKLQIGARCRQTRAGSAAAFWKHVYIYTHTRAPGLVLSLAGPVALITPRLFKVTTGGVLAVHLSSGSKRTPSPRVPAARRGARRVWRPTRRLSLKYNRRGHKDQGGDGREERKECVCVCVCVCVWGGGGGGGTHSEGHTTLSSGPLVTQSLCCCQTRCLKEDGVCADGHARARHGNKKENTKICNHHCLSFFPMSCLLSHYSPPLPTLYPLPHNTHTHTHTHTHSFGWGMEKHGGEGYPRRHTRNMSASTFPAKLLLPRCVLADNEARPSLCYGSVPDQRIALSAHRHYLSVFSAVGARGRYRHHFPSDARTARKKDVFVATRWKNFNGSRSHG